ncbi:MAG: hypothetical protein LAT64_11765 [Phycisphaerales bacterium]|nr:hypothetical protein [Planctomycetota bacterium]MCH8509428.1 hypothetical protein [Phycisphaerales bacterium]
MRFVLMTGSWDEQTRARLACVAWAMHRAGPRDWSVAVVAPGSPGDLALPETARFIPARRRDDAPVALDHLARDGRWTIECFDHAAARCARGWRDDAGVEAAVLLQADAITPGADAAPVADAVLCPTEAHARRAAAAGFDAARIVRAPWPLTPPAPFGPGSETVLCAAPIGPGRRLIELIDAWAASGCGAESAWTLRFAGPIEDAAFAQRLSERAVCCAGVTLSERTHDDTEIADASVLIDPVGAGEPDLLIAAARARPVFAPEGSATAESVNGHGSPFVYPLGEGITGLISVFDRLSGLNAADFAETGAAARARVLRAHTPTDALAARRAAIEAATPNTAAPTDEDPGAWGRFDRSAQSPPCAARLRRALIACHSQGFRRVALYGAGSFVRRCADALCEPPIEIIGFMDDDPARRGKRVWGYPVLCPDVALTADLDAIILTAPSCEEQLWERTAWFRDARIRIIPLNGRHADLPAARAA